MKRIDKILVPVDFSSHSHAALRAAAELATRYGAALALVHVYQPIAATLPDGYVLYTPAQMADLLTQLERQLGAAKREAEVLGAERVETNLLQGVIAAEIIDFAKDHGVGLIVMGTHGRTGLPHVLLGSVTERVVRMAPCPVLTLKAQGS